MKLKHQIPKHIYDRVRAADVGDPDFYVGPTMVERESPNGSAAARDRNASLKTRMEDTKREANQAAAVKQQTVRMARAEGRRSALRRITRILTRSPFRRTGTAR